MDRRVKYTRRVLNESLIRFLESKEITKITVTEICSDADVNRSTYYAHFTDPYDQLAKLKSELLGEMADYAIRIDTRKLPPEEVRYVVLRALLEYFETKKNIFRILLGKSANHNLQEAILSILGEKAFGDELKNAGDEESTCYLMYASNGCFGLFYHWLMNDGISLELTAKRMADYTGSLLKSMNG